MRKREIGSMALSTVRRFYPKVEVVLDAEHPINVEVTPATNRRAAVKNHQSCAMAVACKDKMHADGAIIGIRSAYIIKGKKAIRFSVPERVRREIVAFDRNAGFMPGDYRLLPPGNGRTLGTDFSGNTHNPSNRRRPKLKAFTTAGIRTDLRFKREE